MALELLFKGLSLHKKKLALNNNANASAIQKRSSSHFRVWKFSYAQNLNASHAASMPLTDKICLDECHKHQHRRNRGSGAVFRAHCVIDPPGFRSYGPPCKHVRDDNTFFRWKWTAKHFGIGERPSENQTLCSINLKVSAWASKKSRVCVVL